MKRSVGVKHYGFEWFERFDGDYGRDADALISHGVDFGILQNLITPVPTTAAAPEIQPGNGAGHRSRGYDDHELRDALLARGIEYYEVVPMFFDPVRAGRVPNSRPIANTGTPMRQQGWYVGLCPTDTDHLEERTAAAEQVVQRFRPKGIYLDWIRFPGFWEMWLPQTTRAEILDYCYCARCLASFQDHSGSRLPNVATQECAAIILNEMKQEWTDWKCSVVTSAIAAMKRAAQRIDPDIEIMTSNVAFGSTDYDNAIEEVLGQRVEAMAQHADLLTLMFYHQIVRREPGSWITRMADEIDRKTSRRFLATLQLRPAYLEPEYAAGGRDDAISSAELRSALQSVAASPADGVVLYHWSDYLEMDDTEEDRAFMDAVWSFREGTVE